MTILPPESLFLPVLPITSGGKMKFGLCRICIEEMVQNFCTHTDKERALVGVWTTSEISFAISCGYKVENIWEAFVYKEQIFLFRSFYTRLAEIKLKAEGFPNNVNTEAEKIQYVNELNRGMPGLNLKVDGICRNEPTRQFAKDLSNGGLGRLSQDHLKRNVKYIAHYFDYVKLVYGSPHLDVKSFVPIFEHLAEISYVPKDEMMGVHKNTQSIIYAFVTAFARIGMMKDMRRLMKMGAKIFYRLDRYYKGGHLLFLKRIPF